MASLSHVDICMYHMQLFICVTVSASVNVDRFMYAYCLPKLLYCWLVTIFTTCVNSAITSLNSLIRVSFISFITTSVHLVSYLSGQMLLSQQAPMSHFHCLFFWVAYLYVMPVWYLPVLQYWLYCLCSTHHLIYNCMCPVLYAPYCHIMWPMCLSAHSVCCLLEVYSSSSLVHHLGNLCFDGGVLHMSLYSCNDMSCLGHPDPVWSAVVLFRATSQYYPMCPLAAIFPVDRNEEILWAAWFFFQHIVAFLSRKHNNIHHYWIAWGYDFFCH